MHLFICCAVATLSHAFCVPISQLELDLPSHGNFVDSSSKYELDRAQYSVLFTSNPLSSNIGSDAEELEIDLHRGLEVEESQRNCYILRFHDATDRNVLARFEKMISEVFKGESKHMYEEALKGHAICFPDNEMPLQIFKEIKWIRGIERDRKYKATQIQSNAPYGLYRVNNQSVSTQPNIFGFDYTGEGSIVYIMDTAIEVDHSEIVGRAKMVFTASGVTNSPFGSLCSGHGTQVASLVGGTTVGVAKLCTLRGVAVLDCNGDGYASDILSGLNWILSNNPNPERSVINMSLGGPKSSAIDTAVSNTVKKGFVLTVASGNEGQNACGTSPGGNPDVISVGAINSSDARAPFSNFGPCVTIFAPGEDVTCANANGGLKTTSGTSFASPYVAGVLALLFQKNKGASASDTKNQMLSLAQPDKISSVGLNGSPNLVLQAPTYDPANTAVLIDFNTGKAPDQDGDGTSNCVTSVILFVAFSYIVVLAT